MGLCERRGEDVGGQKLVEVIAGQPLGQIAGIGGPHLPNPRQTDRFVRDSGKHQRLQMRIGPVNGDRNFQEWPPARWRVRVDDECLEFGNNLVQRGCTIGRDGKKRCRTRNWDLAPTGLGVRELDDCERMAIASFGRREGKGRAGISNRHCRGNCLRPMQVTESDICSSGVEQAGCFSFLAAHDDAAFGEFGNLAARDMQVASQDQRTVASFGNGPVRYFSVEGSKAVLAKVTGAAKRDRSQETYGFSVVSSKWNEERIDVRHAVLAGERTDETDVPVSKQCGGKVYTTCTIVIAAKDDDLKVRPSLRRCIEEGEESAHRSDRWVGDIINVACDQQNIGTGLFNLLKKPTQESVVLILARMCMQFVTEVPVRRVNQSQ